MELGWRCEPLLHNSFCQLHSFRHQLKMKTIKKSESDVKALTLRRLLGE